MESLRSIPQGRSPVSCEAITFSIQKVKTNFVCRGLRLKKLEEELKHIIMAIIGYDAEKEEVPNDEKIKNCFTLSMMMLVGMPLMGVLLYFLKKIATDSGRISGEGAQQLFSAYVILAIILTLGIIFTLLYLRRKLKQEEKEKGDSVGKDENAS